MDVTQALKDAENSLRDFIASMLSTKHGDSWIEHTGVAPERIQKWNERKEIEAKRQVAGVVEERLLYYADFYDLKTILKKNWSELFSAALGGDWKTMEVWLTELERLRDPDAHRRELLPHQKHLILGISGEIRNRIVRYRSKQETAEDYFPRIESIRDSLGHIWTAGDVCLRLTGAVLRPGDEINFVVTASDPMDQPLSYGLVVFGGPGSSGWQDNGTFSLRIMNEHIGTSFHVNLAIKSPRAFHASSSGWDDSCQFIYNVLPPKK